MLPRLQISVTRRTIYDFASLEDAATRVERSYETLTRYRTSPPPEQSIFPDLAYRPPRKSAKGPTAIAAAGIAGVQPARGKKNERKLKKKAPSIQVTPVTAAATSSATANTSASTPNTLASVNRNVKC